MSTNCMAGGERTSAKIAHLSDLHFVPETDPDNDRRIRALMHDIRDWRPNLIVVTGDLIDNAPLSRLKKDSVRATLGIARRFLKTLCTECDLDPSQRLFVVPGNHDYRLWGLLSWDSCDDRSAFVDTLGTYYCNRFIHELNLQVFCFDSNVTDDLSINFATGFVSENEILDAFPGKALPVKTEDGSNDGSSSPRTDTLIRIALLHHHPMPIVKAYTPDVTDKEEFLLLRNAGVFMKEMAKNDIDVVLHGHKHWPGYSRAGFPDDDGHMKYIGVIAAGTATEKDPYSSYNRISIDNEGGIITEYRWYQGATFSRMSQKLDLLTEQEIRENRRYKLHSCIRRDTHMKVDGYTSRTTISRSGDATSRDAWVGVRSYPETTLKSVPLAIHVPPGVAAMSQPRVVDCSQNQTVNIDEHGITFDPSLSTSPIKFAIETFSTNTFFFNERDLLAYNRREGIPGNEESVSLMIRSSTGRASLVVEFPEGTMPVTPWLKVHRIKTDGSIGAVDERETKKWNPYLLYVKESNVLFCTITDPFPGFCYRLSWRLPADDPRPTPDTMFHTGVLREIRGKLSNVNPTQYGTISARLNVLREDVSRLDLFGSIFSRSDFHVLLYGFDDKHRHLKLAGHAGCSDKSFGPDHDIKTKAWFLGEELVGQALRRREAILFSTLLGHGQTGSKSAEVLVCEKTIEAGLKLVLAFPLHYPPRDDADIFGVMAFASCSRLCGLHQAKDDREGMAEVLGLSYQHIKGLLEDLIH